MRGATPGIPAFTIPSIPIRSRKSRRLSEEETPTVKEGSQKIPYATNSVDMQRADDASARGSVLDDLNEPKGPGDASHSEGKGKVDPVDKKAEKKRIAAMAKADLEAGRIPTFRIGGTCEVLPSKTHVAQSLGVIPPASLLVNSDSAAIPIINLGSRIIAAYEATVAEKEEQIKSLLACTDVDATRKELDRQKARADSWEVSANANRQSADDYASQVEVLKGEKQRLDDEVQKIDVHLKAASAEIAGSRANLEKSRFTENRLRKELDEARSRADEIASGSSARRARHSSRLEWIRSYRIALHTQVCYRRGARMSLEKMMEAEYELLPALHEKYVKEEEEYLAKVESFDPLGDDTLFPTPPPPPAGLPRDAASQPSLPEVSKEFVIVMHTELSSWNGNWRKSFSRRRIERALSAEIFPGKILGRGQARMSFREEAALKAATKAKRSSGSSTPRVLSLFFDRLVSDYDEDVRSRDNELSLAKEANAALQSSLDEFAERNKVLERDALSVQKVKKDYEDKLTKLKSRCTKAEGEVVQLRGQLSSASDLQRSRIEDAVAEVRDEMARAFADRTSEVAGLLAEIGGKVQNDMLNLTKIDTNFEFIGLFQGSDPPDLPTEVKALRERHPIYDAHDVFTDRLVSVQRVLEIPVIYAHAAEADVEDAED
ncbi:hypothetical protein AALP_AAs63728U000100 [Arabis alpina]|uniref:Uncharacterized protein n=1 Tax=Arabis alpina TaxID=50452 RepID=A0A087G2Z8_ARAAL|nr:hypothetical protein AALP_AAs63728U000100 [Arabis alpina]